MRSRGPRSEKEQPTRARLRVLIVSGAFLFIGLLFIAGNKWIPSLYTFSTSNETPTQEAQSGRELHSEKVMKPQRENMEYTMTLPANVLPIYRQCIELSSTPKCQGM